MLVETFVDCIDKNKTYISNSYERINDSKLFRIHTDEKIEVGYLIGFDKKCKYEEGEKRKLRSKAERLKRQRENNERQKFEGDEYDNLLTDSVLGMREKPLKLKGKGACELINIRNRYSDKLESLAIDKKENTEKYFNIKNTMLAIEMYIAEQFDTSNIDVALDCRNGGLTNVTDNTDIEHESFGYYYVINKDIKIEKKGGNYDKR